MLTEPKTFDWPLAYEAENLLRQYLELFFEKNEFARALAARMQGVSGTEFYEFVDHLTVGPDQVPQLHEAGLVIEDIDAPAEVYHHPRAMMPRVLIKPVGWSQGPTEVALKTDSVVDFVARHDLGVPIEGKFGSRLRRATVAEADGSKLSVVERLGYRGFKVTPPSPGFAEAVGRARELWRTRKRRFDKDGLGAKHALELQQQVLALVGPDVACELFFSEERVFWEFRNRAARIQKRRQDFLGLGWANHDHHTFRSSRALFADLMVFLDRFGFEKRERYYAGAQAGWGAQILEQFVTGITVFADVDLMPEETEIDFSEDRLPPSSKLRTVGLWCGLHGDSWLQAGMHHLEARFDFALLREQLITEGVNTMKPFSDFPFLKQAFTEGERWAVEPARIEALERANLITVEQAETFRREGAIGSHLENLERKGGFKGFNQKSVSVIIEATDPRHAAVAH